MTEHSNGESVLFVHAHPDDESITTGGTIRLLTLRGSRVTVLTCTRGEAGDVIPESHAHLRENHDELARHRESELAAAMRILGVRDHRYLGNPGARAPGASPRRYRDSGMVDGANGPEKVPQPRPDSLVAADTAEVCRDVAAVIDDIGATAVVSYNSRGGYGHPDHIAAHLAARRAADERGIPFFSIQPEDSPSTRTIDVDVSTVLGEKKAAMAAHRSQLIVHEDDTFELSNRIRQPVGRTERYLLAPARPIRRPLGTRILESVVGVVLGFAVAAVLTGIHQWTLTIADVPIPVGVIAALTAVTALLLGLRLLGRSATLAIATATGIIASIALFALPSVGGSILVPGNAAGLAWIFAPSVLSFIVLGWPRRRAGGGERTRYAGNRQLREKDTVS